MEFRVLALNFEESLKLWTLDIEVKSIKDFWNNLICEECRKSIERNEVTYFCKEGGFFFHRECCIRSRHGLRYQSYNHPEHSDFRIIIYPKEEKNAPTIP